jgi:hypothetical protein
MSTWEVAAENGHRVRVEAEDEAEAFATALEMDPDIEMAGAYPADGLPIGWDGGDAEDALE